jgi:peptidoglycan hydrolase-like protein with peptidoglycan-binding domain
MHLAHAQRRLKELGYDASDDGVVNQKNRDAMRQFQERNGLEPTGLLDMPTEQKLLSAEAVKAETTPAAPAPAEEPPLPRQRSVRGRGDGG